MDSYDYYEVNMLFNSIKYGLISKYVRMIRRDLESKVNVLDIGNGGDGQDQIRWERCEVRSVTYVDVQVRSIRVCMRRYGLRALSELYDASFFVADLTREFLVSEIGIDKMCYDLVCSHCVSDSFVDEMSADTFCRNVSELLKIGGYFIGTILNYFSLLKRCVKSADQSTGNEMFAIKFDQSVDLKKAIPSYGVKYYLTTSKVIERLEYLVKLDVFVKLMKKHGLELAQCKQFYDSGFTIKGKPSEKDWEYASLYMIFAFKKVKCFKY